MDDPWVLVAETFLIVCRSFVLPWRGRLPWTRGRPQPPASPPPDPRRPRAPADPAAAVVHPLRPGPAADRLRDPRRPGGAAAGRPAGGAPDRARRRRHHPGHP